MTIVVIERGIALPEKRGGNSRGIHYPFGEMDVDDSFFIPGLNAAYSVPSARSEYVRRNHHLELRFETRGFESDPVHQTHGVRVWRTR